MSSLRRRYRRPLEFAIARMPACPPRALDADDSQAELERAFKLILLGLLLAEDLPLDKAIALAAEVSGVAFAHISKAKTDEVRENLSV
jgi:hypothetical protein